MQKIDMLGLCLSDNLDKLRPFNLVVKTGSINRAAKALNLSQSALSHMISKLETNLGFPLFHRGNGGLTLTEKGETLHLWVQSLLTKVGELAEVLGSEPETPAKRIRVGTHETLAIHLWPEVIQKIEKSHAEYLLSLTSGRVDVIAEQVLRGDLDVGLTVEPKPDPKLKIYPVYRGRLGFYCSPKWGGGRHPRKLDSKELKGVSFFTDSGAHLRQGLSIPRALTLTGIRDLGPFEISSFEAAVRLASMGLGIAIIPDRNAERAVAEGRLTPISIAGISGKRELEYQISFLYRADSQRAADYKIIYQEIMARVL